LIALWALQPPNKDIQQQATHAKAEIIKITHESGGLLELEACAHLPSKNKRLVTIDSNDGSFL
jgi:hypothetical protein